MTQNELTLLYNYFYNHRVKYERTVQTLQSNLRFREITVADCVELICAVQQLETFREVCNNVSELLKLRKQAENF